MRCILSAFPQTRAFASALTCVQMWMWCNSSTFGGRKCLAGDKAVRDGDVVSVTAPASALLEPVPNSAVLMMQIGPDLCRVCAFWAEKLGVFLGKTFLYQQSNERFGLLCLENEEAVFLCLWVVLLPWSQWNHTGLHHLSIGREGVQKCVPCSQCTPRKTGHCLHVQSCTCTRVIPATLWARLNQGRGIPVTGNSICSNCSTLIWMFFSQWSWKLC